MLVDGGTVARIILRDADAMKAAVREALRIHHAKRLVQPLKQYLQRGTDAHPADRVIAMSAYLPVDPPVAGLKWIGSHPDNHRRGLPRANAILVLNDPETNAPTAILGASFLSAMRTLFVSLIAIERLCPEPESISIVGIGRLGRLHVEYLPRTFPSLKRILCYSRTSRFDDLLDRPHVTACDRLEDALSNADVVITTTSAAEPYIHTADLCESALLVNLSLMDFGEDVFRDADAIVVDDVDQCVKARKVFKRCVDSGIIDVSRVVELGDTLFGAHRDRAFGGRVMVNTIGMAVEDLAVAREVASRVDPADAGWFNLEPGDETAPSAGLPDGPVTPDTGDER
jgi:ornithine cyclodeaminase